MITKKILILFYINDNFFTKNFYKNFNYIEKISKKNYFVCKYFFIILLIISLIIVFFITILVLIFINSLLLIISTKGMLNFTYLRKNITNGNQIKILNTKKI